MIARDLAQLINVSEATISRLCSGERRPSVEVMGRIKEALGWSLDDQWRALAAETYETEFKDRMDRRGFNAASAAVRS